MTKQKSDFYHSFNDKWVLTMNLKFDTFAN